MKKETYTHIDGSELFRLMDDKLGKDYEGDFNDSYMPSQSCSVLFWIPKEEEFEEEMDEEWRRAIALFLLENGFNYGDDLYIDIDY